MGTQKILNRFLQCAVTCCYTGYLPRAPGTWASLLGCVLIYFFPVVMGNLFFVAALTVISVLLVHFFRYEGEDPGYIVIDELVGMCVTMAGHRPTLMHVAIGFVCFRFFDIVKPFPVKQAERLKGALGIVADDITAGILASIVLFIAGFFI